MIDTPRQKPETLHDFMKQYPRITAHIICESLGYATPSCAARILKDAKEGRPNYTEWVWSSYRGDPAPVVHHSIRNRYAHHGYMAEYRLAMALVERAARTGDEPVFASWF